MPEAQSRDLVIIDMPQYCIHSAMWRFIGAAMERMKVLMPKTTSRQESNMYLSNALLLSQHVCEDGIHD